MIPSGRCRDSNRGSGIRISPPSPSARHDSSARDRVRQDVAAPSSPARQGHDRHRARRRTRAVPDPLIPRLDGRSTVWCPRSPSARAGRPDPRSRYARTPCRPRAQPRRMSHDGVHQRYWHGRHGITESLHTSMILWTVLVCHLLPAARKNVRARFYWRPSWPGRSSSLPTARP